MSSNNRNDETAETAETAEPVMDKVPSERVEQSPETDQQQPIEPQPSNIASVKTNFQPSAAFDKDTFKGRRLSEVKNSLSALAKKPDNRLIFQQILKEEPRAVVRETALITWERSGNVDTETVLNVFRDDDSKVVRIKAAAILARSKPWEAMPVMFEGMRDSNIDIRRAAYKVVRSIVGAEFGYKPEMGSSSREKALANIEANWQDYKHYYDEKKKLEALEKKQSK